MVQSYHIHKVSHKYMSFNDEYDLEGQGQCHQFQTHLKPLDDQV